MCYGCWIDEGKPSNVTPSVLKAAPMIQEADEFGAMHIVVSDWNLEDDNVRFCLAEARLTPEERILGSLLLDMPYIERVTAMALADGFIDANGIDLTVL